MSLQEPPQIFRAHAGVRENPAKRSFGDIATLVHRYGGASAISVTHDVVAAGDAG
jgi:hypothetical protein